MSICVKSVDGVWFGVACEDDRVFATSFAFDEKSVLRSLKDSLPSNVVSERPSTTSGFAERVLGVLKSAYDGKDVADRVPLDMERLSGYTRRVIEAVCMIPVGYVSSYGLVAKAVGGAPRAVGHAMATNPYAPLCPCHRVVGSDFGLCGYGGGLKVKLDFLGRERRGFASERDIAVGKGKLHVFPVERVLEKAGKKGKR
jgi:methylated-DNA-[protein]-cysteine S-methyltransferase